MVTCKTSIASILLLTCLFSGCVTDKKPKYYPKEAETIMMDDGLIYPVIVAVFSDNKLINKQVIRFHFELEKHRLTPLYAYCRHESMELYRSPDSPGYTFPAMHVFDHLSGDSTSLYTILSFRLVYSEGALNQPDNRIVSSGTSHGYNDHMTLSGRHNFADFQLATIIPCSTTDEQKKVQWAVKRFKYKETQKVGDHYIRVEMYAKPFSTKEKN